MDAINRVNWLLASTFLSLPHYHIEPLKLKRIYQRGKRETEMRDAWRILGERLDLLTGADDRNVVMLSLRAA